MDPFDQLQAYTSICLNPLRPRRHRLLDVRRRRRHASFPTGMQAHLRREKRRLRAHFRAVLAELRTSDVSHLSPNKQAARARLLEELAQYARTGRFPINFDFPGLQMPYFIDSLGTRCAVAHLIESTGEIDLVARVATSANNAFVPELESDGAFRTWLDEHGLTAAEAARIQPSYCFVTKGEDCVCSRIFFSVDAVVEVTVMGPITMNKGTVRIDAIHGDTTLAMVGQEMEADFNIPNVAVGTSVLGTIAKTSPTRPFLRFQLTNDDHVVLPCTTSLTLTTQEMIDVMMSASCTESLTKIDPAWGQSICDSKSEEDSGCAIASSHGFSPLVFAPLLVAAAYTARRRARRRAHK